MQILAKNPLLIFLIFAIILCVYPLYTIANIRNLTYEENIYEPTVHMWDTKIYDDNTVVMRMVGKKPTEDKTCFYEMFSLRIIYPNGTVEKKDIGLDVHPINYCLPSITKSSINIYNNQNDAIKPLDYLDYHLISRKDHILITYYNVKDAYTYEEWGMTIDLNGTVIDRTLFGPAFINGTTNEPIPISRVRFNIDREKGFLRLATVGNSGDLSNVKIVWQQYKVETDGTFTKLTDGILKLDNFSSLFGVIMSTVDEGYAIAYIEENPQATVDELLLPQRQLFVLPIEYNKGSTSSLLLYQNFLQQSTLIGLSCDISLANTDNVNTCTLTVSQTNPDNPVRQIYYVKINFLTPGSVINSTVFKLNDFLDPQDNNWIANELPFGGYLLTGYPPNGNINLLEPTTLDGYFVYNDKDFEWEFGRIPITTNGIFQILRNNTLLVGNETSNSWQFHIIDLPTNKINFEKFFREKNQVREYKFNAHISTTIPEIYSIINPDMTPNILITFNKRVELSNGKLSIYQVGNGRNLLRQSISGINCSMIDDTTVSVDVLESTFDMPNATYFIEVKNDFVKNTANNEPLIGIRKNIWSFTTEEKNDTFVPSTTGLLRLTSEGTQFYDILSQEERHKFFGILLMQLSEAIPVQLSRLTTTEKTQLDSRSSKNQWLIPISISETKDLGDNNAASISKIIDIMVHKKDQTPIGLGSVTRYLDETYGFKRLPSLWEDKTTLISSFLIIGFFIFLFLFAEAKTYGNKDKKDIKNVAILQFGVIIFDWSLYLVFLMTNSRDVLILYIPSIVFFTFPIVINTILAFDIIAQENLNKEFYLWFIKDGQVSYPLTAFACIDITALNILESNLVGWQSFNAPFSTSAKSKIIWGNFLNILAEDIPQLSIQIYYRYNSVTYETIPLLALISSSVKLAMDTIGILYEVSHRVDMPKYSDGKNSGSNDNSKNDNGSDGKNSKNDNSNDGVNGFKIRR